MSGIEAKEATFHLAKDGRVSIPKDVGAVSVHLKGHPQEVFYAYCVKDIQSKGVSPLGVVGRIIVGDIALTGGLASGLLLITEPGIISAGTVMGAAMLTVGGSAALLGASVLAAPLMLKSLISLVRPQVKKLGQFRGDENVSFSLKGVCLEEKTDLKIRRYSECDCCGKVKKIKGRVSFYSVGR